MQKQKIFYIITKSNWGGAQRHVFDLATNLPKSKFDISVILGGNGELSKRLKEEKIKVISLSRLGRDVKLLDEFFIFFKLIKIFWKEKPTIIHLHSSKIGGLGSLAGRIARVSKIIFTVHGWPFNEERHFLSKFLIRTLSWLTILFSHKIITVSKYDANKGREMAFGNNKITVVHNGISRINFIEKEEARTQLNISKKNILCFGTIAELTKNKGLEYSIKAFGELKKTIKESFVFIIIGKGEDEDALKKLIEKYELKNNIFLVGHKKNAKELLKAFDIFVMSSIKEGLPYVLLEAGLAKLPVIATNVGGISEIIEDLETGILVRSKDSDEISKTIQFLLNNPEKMTTLGQNLSKKINSQFSRKKMLEETILLYDNYFLDDTKSN